MKKTLLLTNILIALGISNIAIADEVVDSSEINQFDDELGDFYGSEYFVSIATGNKKSLSKAPSVATVITSQQIRELGATSIHQVIETVTGIHVYPSNFNRMNASYSIRGIHTRQNPQVLVLVNGDRVRENWTGAKWDSFNTGVDIVERIEIIRGPGSAVHGADAFSGVINIVTKGYDSKSENSVGLRAGSFGTKSAWINFSRQIDSLKLAFNAQVSDAKGDDSRIVYQDVMYSFGLGELSNAPGALDTRATTTDVHLNFADEHLYGGIWYLRNNGGTGSGAAQALSNNDSHTSETFTYRLGYKIRFENAWDFDLSTSYQDYEQSTYFVIFPPGMALPRAFDPNTGLPSAFTLFTDGVIGKPILYDDNYTAEIVGNYSGVSNQNFRIGMGYLRNEMKAEEFKNFGPIALDFTENFRDGELTNVSGTEFVFSPNVNREVYYLSLQNEWKFTQDWELTSGVRYDDYSDFGSTINPRLALVWQAKQNLTAKALYGRAFRAPAFDELYAINNPVILGNTNLKPEIINTFEIALDYRPSFDWKVLFNIFRYKADNLIIYTAQNDGSNKANNAGEQNGKGAELEVHWQINESIDSKLGFSWQDAEDVASGENIADAPQKMFDFSLDWTLTNELKMLLTSRWVLDRDRSISDSRNRIDNYNWTNMNIIYKVNNDMNFALSIRNLFDKQAFEPSDGQIPDDFPLEERGFWLSSSYHF